jgi:hypothetical protein
VQEASPGILLLLTEEAGAGGGGGSDSGEKSHHLLSVEEEENLFKKLKSESANRWSPLFISAGHSSHDRST